MSIKRGSTVPENVCYVVTVTNNNEIQSWLLFGGDEYVARPITTAFLVVPYSSLERAPGGAAKSLLSVRLGSYVTCFSLKFYSILPVLAYQIIIKIIALKSSSQVNGTLLRMPLH